jgi:photosystem II stability/assembly factor-like uncharacterized protein
MKKTSIFFAAIFTVIIIAYISPLAADWHRFASSVDDQLNSIHICNNKDIYISASNSIILRYFAASEKWDIDTLGSSLVLENIYFFDDCTNGFICGNRGTFSHSESRGKFWTSLNFDTSLWLFDMDFIDNKTGFLVGGNYYSKNSFAGVAYKTSDAGKTWDSLPIAGRQLQYVDISPKGIISIIGIGKLFISRDTGSSWEAIVVPSGRTVTAVGLWGASGLMVGMGGFIAISNDSGRTWLPHNVLPEDIHLLDLLMLDAKHIYVIGSLGAVLYSDDGGKNWIPEATGVAYQLLDIEISGNKIFACGEHGTIIYKEIAK